MTDPATTAAASHSLAAYWSAAELHANGLVFLNLLGALVLGSLVGYERAYHGRAAGMRTYGLVCMASTGLTAVIGYPSLWFGGTHELVTAGADPTRVIQGIVTGIGFLGAGVIMKEGLSISGLTTAASIWAACAIGVLIGVGFYLASILLALLSASAMMWGAKVEHWLPSHPALGVTLRFDPGVHPDASGVDAFLHGHGYKLARGSLCISGGAATEWRCVITAIDREIATPLDGLSLAFKDYPGVAGWSVVHARN